LSIRSCSDIIKSNHASTIATTKRTITTRSTTRHTIAPIKSMNTFRHNQKRILDNKQKKPRMREIFNSRKGRPINMNLKRMSDRNKLAYFRHSKDLRKEIAFLLDLIMSEHDNRLVCSSSHIASCQCIYYYILGYRPFFFDYHWCD
jgi:hypothetical protein